MRKLILQMQMSVDGFVGSDTLDDWQLWDWGDNNGWDAALKREFNRHFASLDTILLSRKMAEEGYLAHWGNAAKRFPRDTFYAFAKRIVDVQKVVLTDKLKKSKWDRTVLKSGNLTREVTALKKQKGRAIGVFGGAGFAAALISAGVVDEFQFYINPAVLGSGVRIFDESTFGALKLLEAKAYKCGMVVGKYAPRHR
ncbi:MAG TPA: dihydrofolate reductase family protein [Opitutaceae bacterium]|nr:dihydrofolate reductase family protein [Opitutaceae bacterium]